MVLMWYLKNKEIERLRGIRKSEENRSAVNEWCSRSMRAKTTEPTIHASNRYVAIGGGPRVVFVFRKGAAIKTVCGAQQLHPALPSSGAACAARRERW